ncbi:MAG: sulfite exporter TauE/SafE family protein [Comamonadaceae bacterium]|nr:sulfite exporter TauE/SafE family protein [Comamonadaceae bacterium]
MTLASLPPWLPVALAIFVLAGLVKGVVGLGLPTVAMGLLALRLPPAEAAALLVVPSLVTNVWQTRPWGTLAPLARRLAGLLLGVCAGTWLGAWLLGAPAGAWARVALGAALIAYALWSLAGAVLQAPPRMQRWLGPLVGAATGLVTAATGVFVVPAVPYLQALGLQRDAFVQAMGLSFTVSTLALAVGLAGNASFSGGTLGWSLLMLAPALLGMALGGRLRQRLSPLWFRRCLMVGLLLLGGHMVVA